MKKNPTSEEKLLKLIRKKDRSAPKKRKKAASGEKKNVLKQSLFVAFLSVINKVLIVLCLLIVAYMVVLVQRAQDSAKQILPDWDQAADSVPRLSSESVPGKAVEGSFEEYNQIFSNRDLFSSPWEKPVPEEEPLAEQQPVFNRSLKVVGLVLDGEPQAIIEDREMNQTFFVTVGQSVGDAVVAEITEDKVLLDVNGQQMELAP